MAFLRRRLKVTRVRRAAKVIADAVIDRLPRIQVMVVADLRKHAAIHPGAAKVLIVKATTGSSTGSGLAP